MEIRELLMEHIRRADRSGAGQLIQTWANNFGSQRLLSEVLEPTLHAVGEDWYKEDSFTLAQAYVTSKIAEDVMDLVLRDASALQTRTTPKGPVVIGNIEEDFHALGRKLVGTFLKSQGWQVIDLGNDVPAKAFVDQALSAGAHVIGVSAMTLSTARNIARVREEITRRGLEQHIKIAVGGAVFCLRPTLCEEIGADGSAPNAFEASQLFTRLWNASVAHPKFA